MNLTQIKASISKLIGQDVTSLSDAELAQRLEDEAASTETPSTENVETQEAVVVVTEEAVETPPAVTTSEDAGSVTPFDSSEIESRIDGLAKQVSALSNMVTTQASTITDLNIQIESLLSLNTVLTNKVVALNVASTSTTAQAGNPVNAVNTAIAKAEDNTKVTMNMGDFLGIKQPSK